MNEPLAPPGSWSTSEGIPSLERDLLLTERDFSRIRQLIHERAGIVLAEHKREMVYSRLAKRLRHHGLTRFSDYLERLERRPDAREWEAFTNALTTNLTAFFREAHHFPLLAEHASSRVGGYRVWSAAASTGEEPYSIAMTLSDAFNGNTSKFEVIATDIDTEALARARAGVYSIEQISRLDEGLKRRHFLRGKGRHEGMARVQPDVSRQVAFQSLNLLAPGWDLDGKFDAIFCRNVMIYFDKPTQTRLLERFAPLLKPDGLLFAGHSENFSQISDAFRLRGQTVYRLAGR